jgi:general L-amino acid transport system permease protein
MRLSYRDAKLRGLMIQGLLLLAIVLVVALLVTTTFGNLRTRGIPLGFDFLAMPAQIVISESILTYKPDDSHYRAIAVGIANTLFVSTLVIIMSSVLGLVVGLARLSGNPLASGTSRIWVEIARNFPPIVILIFLYSLWWKAFPAVESAWTLMPGVFLSMRGLNMPMLELDIAPAGLALALGGTLAWAFRARLSRATGAPMRAWLWVALGLVAAGCLLADPQARIDRPEFTGSNFSGGLELSPELSTILIGLTVYTTGFIAEIVRGGVLSIGRGQWEAGRTLGLPRAKILRFIVIPQALRVIVPPLNSQYINVVKNSTLAIAVGYPDFLAVMNTIISKSSHSIEGVFIILAVYLCINLALSATANWYNRRIGLVER